MRHSVPLLEAAERHRVKSFRKRLGRATAEAIRNGRVVHEFDASPSSQRPPRERLILAGWHLSRCDSIGLKELGFGAFVEAFNVIRYAKGSKISRT
jgi:hypothetical protein